MKLKILFLVTVLLTVISTTEAQVIKENNVSSKDIDTSIVPIAPIEIDNKDSSMLELYDTIKTISGDNKQHAVAIYHLLQGRELDNLTQYELVKGNIISSSVTYNLLNKAIIALQSGFITDSLDQFVGQLINLDSKEGVFSFNERVINLVKTILFKDKIRGQQDKRVMSSINAMVNDSLLKTSTKIMPSIEIVNSIMTFLRTTAIDNDHINPKRIDKLEQELSKYVIYYSALNDGKQQFQYGLGVIEEELTTLHKNMYFQLRYASQAFNIPLSEWNTSTSLDTVLTDFFVHYSKPSLQTFFDSMEQHYVFIRTKQTDYGLLLRENDKIKEINNQLEDLVLQIKKFDNTENEYFTLLDSYYAQVTHALNIAADSGFVDRKLIKTKQAQLTRMKNNEVEGIKDSVNLTNVISNSQFIKYRYKVF